jgi:hypothetical protein
MAQVAVLPSVWTPGSFTKNFSWGPRSAGLYELYRSIKVGFNGELESVTRQVFRDRVERLRRPDFIPLNFFLLNKALDGADILAVDELVFQALTAEHSERFDLLAILAFNLSIVGSWRGASAEQRRPAMWAHHYMSDRVGPVFDWDPKRISADDIERFVISDVRYRGKTARKLATNLSYLYSLVDLGKLSYPNIQRWWVDALFLALDRTIAVRRSMGLNPNEREYHELLQSSGFFQISGRRSLEKELAANHLVRLYVACGGPDRFSDAHVRERTMILAGDLQHFAANDPRPRGAVHPTNPHILKSVPRTCAMLVKYAGFVDIGPDELEHFDVDDFVRKRTLVALESLRERRILPTMSAEELIRLVRDQ